MDRLPFASEGCCRKSLICIRPVDRRAGRGLDGNTHAPLISLADRLPRSHYYPDAGSAIAEWREPAGSRYHWSESPTGYSSTGCSPAEPASASPVTDDRSRSGSGIKCAAQPHCKGNVVLPVVFAATWGVIFTLHAECHFCLAPTFYKVRSPLSTDFSQNVPYRTFDSRARYWQTRCHGSQREPRLWMHGAVSSAPKPRPSSARP
jgi:hypothetical protein